MTTLETLLSFETTLMDWMLAVQPSRLADSELGRALLHERKRVYDTLNAVVSDHRLLQGLEEPGDPRLATLQERLERLPKEAAATDSVLELTRLFLAAIDDSTGSSTPIAAARTPAA